MSSDIKKILQNKQVEKVELSKDHRKKFEAKLQTELHHYKKRSNRFLKIAASFLILVGLGTTVYYYAPKTNNTPVQISKIESLGSISPELKKIENYYLVSINAEILNLNETPENKELLDGYLEKIDELSKDYKMLTNELNSEGLNEKTINALIDNLQLRLKLLYQLKEQLNELKKINVKQDENIQV